MYNVHICIADGKRIFLSGRLFMYLIKIKFPQRYIADTHGVACNSRIPQANGSTG
jgi:hypothetical protein